MSVPTFLTLPLEIRDLIYEELFSTITIRHGFGRSPPSHRTALLLTCKQLHFEAWRFLPLHAKFAFRGPEFMLETLLSAEQSVVTRIRHVHIKSFPFPLYASGSAEYYKTYYFANAFSLLPGLHLDRLVVEDSFHGFGLVDGWRDVVSYFDIEALLKCDGWRELVYISQNTDFIASGYDHRKKRQAQPENWDRLLKDRDGDDSGAKVEMFLAPEESGSGAGRELRPWSAQPGNEVILNPKMAGPDQDLKGEVRVVAKRGKRARVVQLGLTDGKTWRELKHKEGGFVRADWTPYYNDLADAVGWLYGGWGRRVQLANRALSY